MLLNASINYLAVLLAAIAAFGLGMVWYGPLFGKYWMGLMGMTPKSIKKMPLTPMQAMTYGFLALLVTSFVTAYLMISLGATTVSQAILLSVLIWLGYLAPLLLGSFLWEGKSINLWSFNATHRLAEIVVIAVVLALLH